MTRHVIGELSPEGKRRWNGVQWIPIDPPPVREERPETVRLSVHTAPGHDLPTDYSNPDGSIWTRDVPGYMMTGGGAELALISRVMRVLPLAVRVGLLAVLIVVLIGLLLIELAQRMGWVSG